MKLILAVILLMSANVFACSCMQWTDAATMLKEADSVVLAVPVEESQFHANDEFSPIMKTGMKIVKRYKGKYKEWLK